MDRTYWHKQTADEPLFPDLLWSRPENKAHAGKLFIAGGNKYSFSAPANAYAEANQAGIGIARALLPSSLQKTVGRVFEAGEYAPSTPSGSFAQQALSEFLGMSQWADATLLAGDFGRNSETAVLLEKFLEKYKGQLTLCCDTVDYFFAGATGLLNRQDVTVVAEMAQLQKLAIGYKFPKPFTSSMDFLHIVNQMHEFTEGLAANVILVHEKTVFIAVDGEISTTQFEKLPGLTKTAAHVAVWWLQNPSKPLEGLTTAAYETQ